MLLFFLTALGVYTKVAIFPANNGVRLDCLHASRICTITPPFGAAPIVLAMDDVVVIPRTIHHPRPTYLLELWRKEDDTTSRFELDIDYDPGFTVTNRLYGFPWSFEDGPDVHYAAVARTYEGRKRFVFLSLLALIFALLRASGAFAARLRYAVRGDTLTIALKQPLFFSYLFSHRSTTTEARLSEVVGIEGEGNKLLLARTDATCAVLGHGPVLPGLRIEDLNRRFQEILPI